PKTTYLSAKDLVAVSKSDTIITRIENLNIPVIGIFGELNKGKFSSEIKLARKFPIYYVPNAGHAMMYDDPIIFLEIVHNFLKTIMNEKRN
ncbi:MAG: hypothetical protein ACFFDW_12155, partial [Candidatus Thorarchaeota archaeon]